MHDAPDTDRSIAPGCRLGYHMVVPFGTCVNLKKRTVKSVPFKPCTLHLLYYLCHMIKVGEVLVSDDIRDKEFVCNLEKCKGACCVEGDFGAPLLEEELAILEEIYPKVKKYLSPEGIKEIEKNGTHTIDDEGELCTPVIGGRECVYAIYDKKGILKCGIEQAYNDGKIGWKKPISCHLYPIRITKKKNFEALNYHKWHICSPACALGKELQVPVYKFLKDPLIRKYGEPWYDELVKVIETPVPKV